MNPILLLLAQEAVTHAYDIVKLIEECRIDSRDPTPDELREIYDRRRESEVRWSALLPDPTDDADEPNHP